MADRTWRMAVKPFGFLPRLIASTERFQAGKCLVLATDRVEVAREICSLSEAVAV